MWETYEEYCSDMDLHGWDKVIEEVWQREYAPKVKPTTFEPMVLTPKNANRVKPTLANHIDPIRREEFKSADDYYDALEAQRLLKQIQGARG